jgi:S1-C subfamily serine protease
VADLQKATVQIIVRGDDGTQIGGSGSVVGAEGLILTNAHVLYNYAAKGLYDTDGKATIAITTDPHRPAKPAYIARLVQLDPKVDLAVLKVASARGGRALPRGFKLRDVFRLADSNAVQIGDQLRVFGFPGVGGNSVTFTRGVVSGFLPYEDMSLIKTDAQFTHGSSGGAAVNDLGELVGVPTAGIADEAGRVGYLVPINSARPLIRKAAAGQRIALGPLKPAPAPTATPTPAPITLPTPTSEPSPGVATETLYVEAASQGYKGAAVRERPSPKSRQLAFLANGTSVQAMPDQIVGEDGEYWYEVVYQGRRAYVLAILLTVSPP